MTGTRAMIVAGLGATDEDFQRIADEAAEGEDRLLRILAAAGGTKRVIPLNDWLKYRNDNPALVTDRGLTGAGSVAVTDSSAWSVTNGRLAVEPAAYLVNSSATSPVTGDALIVAVKTSRTMVGPFSSTVGGRTDVVYATVTEATSVTADRRYKDPTTGERSTQSLAVARATSVTFNVAQGPEGVPATPGTVPADSGTSWNIPLAYITLQAGYTSGDQITTFGVGPATHKARQVWTRGGLSPQMVKTARPGRSTYTAGASASADLPFHRMGSYEVVVATFKHTGNPLNVILDDGRDYRNNLVRLSISRVRAQSWGTVYPAPSRVKEGGLDTGGGELTPWMNAGWDDVFGPFYTATKTPAFEFYVDAATGALRVEVAAAPINGSGDEYVVVVEALESFNDGRTATP